MTRSSAEKATCGSPVVVDFSNFDFGLKKGEVNSCLLCPQKSGFIFFTFCVLDFRDRLPSLSAFSNETFLFFDSLQRDS